MFGLSDVPKFILAFFIVLPVISILHEFGHVFFAWIMGGKNIKVSIGSGKSIFKIGMLDIRQYYFWYGLCTFENLPKRERFGNILIFSGGVLFNIIGIAAIGLLIQHDVLEANIFTYQFTYFSWYYIFFAILPMPYPDGNYSDGKIVWDLIKNKQDVIKERTYQVKWIDEEQHWHVLDHNNSVVRNYEDEEEAIKMAIQIAEGNKPSRVLSERTEGEVKEIHNYPRTPL
ncbi:M50 family metallopeptidase [Christiangramia salexigens]|uniref:Peptidase M50 domain-containing protein n=1 Tax=Christiangramia salexigens TaxID=1913577 RepID=A0A1L3J2I1_9FLAO|nr:M50 family metallopeptidase [Christiangramia salexigens]APG59327.1 hypothetical protein LPB144_02370 [Christiangramia salexigens]